LLHSSHPQASISAALARQAQVGVGSMPKRFKRRDSSVPGPWVMGCGGGGSATERPGHCLGDPQKASATPQRLHVFVALSQSQIMAEHH
jgi:hypothetical protein